MKQPDPDLYYLSTEIGGATWRLEVVRYMQGNPSREVLTFPKHDARQIRRVLESLFDEEWEVNKIE